jgi:hypothetical protein
VPGAIAVALENDPMHERDRSNAEPDDVFGSLSALFGSPSEVP